MARRILVLSIAALLFASGVHGLDFPHIGLQLGFSVHVIPSRNDTSNALGLGVTVGKVINDQASLVVSGTITNYSNVPCDGIAMDFAVTSYIGSSDSRGRAVVEPTSLPPGGTATFEAYITLYSEKPHYAMYTITASTPIPCCPEPNPGTIAPSESEAAQEPPIQ